MLTNVVRASFGPGRLDQGTLATIAQNHMKEPVSACCIVAKWYLPSTVLTGTGIALVVWASYQEFSSGLILGPLLMIVGLITTTVGTWKLVKLWKQDHSSTHKDLDQKGNTSPASMDRDVKLSEVNLDLEESVTSLSTPLTRTNTLQVQQMNNIEEKSSNYESETDSVKAATDFKGSKKWSDCEASYLIVDHRRPSTQSRRCYLQVQRIKDTEDNPDKCESGLETVKAVTNAISDHKEWSECEASQLLVGDRPSSAQSQLMISDRPSSAQSRRSYVLEL